VAKRVRSLSKRGADAFKKGIKGVRKASERRQGVRASDRAFVR